MNIARLVAKKHVKRSCVDFNQTFASIECLDTIRAFVSSQKGIVVVPVVCQITIYK